MDYFCSLPIEIVYLIIDYLKPTNIYSLSETSRFFYNTSNCIQVWDTQYKRHFSFRVKKGKTYSKMDYAFTRKLSLYMCHTQNGVRISPWMFPDIRPKIGNFMREWSIELDCAYKNKLYSSDDFYEKEDYITEDSIKKE